MTNTTDTTTNTAADRAPAPRATKFLTDNTDHRDWQLRYSEVVGAYEVYVPRSRAKRAFHWVLDNILLALLGIDNSPRSRFGR